MKVGCAAWVFTAPRYNPPYEAAIEAIGEIGFESLELILCQKEDLEEYWTSSRIDAIRRQIDRCGLEISEFALYQDAVSHIVSLNPSEREDALETFEKGTVLAKSLGSPLVNMVGQWPIGMKAPIPYVPNYHHPISQGTSRFHPKLRIELPKGFDWDELWETYVESISTCTQIAKAHGLRFALEGHPHVMVPHTDSFLRLWDHVQDSALGFNLDTACQSVQREYLPWSVHKLKEKLLHLHVRDGDGLICYGLPVGMGVIDWHSLVAALRDVGYDGALSLELAAYEDPHYYARSSLDYLKR
jgi:sugar phosphate isomerase/epimerase